MSTAPQTATTQPARPAPRPPTWSQSLGAAPVFALVGAAAVAGIFWLPLWFLAAELLFVWAPRGGMRWLASRGVPEYTDDNVATVIAAIPIVLIAARVALVLDWVAPFKVFVGQATPLSEAETAAFFGLVLGLAMATALSGVLRTTGWPRLVAIAGFAVVTALAGAWQVGLWWKPSPLEASPLIILAYLVSTIVIRTDRRLYRRAARRIGLAEIADSGNWERL